MNHRKLRALMTKGKTHSTSLKQRRWSKMSHFEVDPGTLAIPEAS